MSAQVPLPLTPEGAVPIGDAACLTVDSQGGAVWVWGTLWEDVPVVVELR